MSREEYSKEPEIFSLEKRRTKGWGKETTKGILRAIFTPLSVDDISFSLNGFTELIQDH